MLWNSLCLTESRSEGWIRGIGGSACGPNGRRYEDDYADDDDDDGVCSHLFALRLLLEFRQETKFLL